MSKLEIVQRIIDTLKCKAPLSHIEGGAMTIDLDGSKIVYYIESMQLHKIEDKVSTPLAKLKLINQEVELIGSVSELELLEVLNELER